MKKIIWLCLILFALGLQAKTDGHVAKIKNSLLLIECTGSVGKKGDLITIKRQTGKGILEIGTAKILKVQDNKIIAKILSQKKGIKISIGDFAGEESKSTEMSSYAPREEAMSGSGTPIETMMLQAWPVFPDNQDHSTTSLEKMLSGIAYKE